MWDSDKAYQWAYSNSALPTPPIYAGEPGHIPLRKSTVGPFLSNSPPTAFHETLCVSDLPHKVRNKDFQYFLCLCSCHALIVYISQPQQFVCNRYIARRELDMLWNGYNRSFVHSSDAMSLYRSDMHSSKMSQGRIDCIPPKYTALLV